MQKGLEASRKDLILGTNEALLQFWHKLWATDKINRENRRAVISKYIFFSLFPNRIVKVNHSYEWRYYMLENSDSSATDFQKLYTPQSEEYLNHYRDVVNELFEGTDQRMGWYDPWQAGLSPHINFVKQFWQMNASRRIL